MVALIVIGILVLFFLLFMLAIRGRASHPGMAELKGWSYAHRGLHSEGVPENSMAAFEAAKKAGYGVELDVHLLSDGNLAVLHDFSLDRVTGQSGNIEDLTARQLRDCKLCGTEEIIPQFDHVLEMFEGEVPLIVELKATKKNYKALCKAVCRRMESYPGAYCIESFDPRCILWLKRHRPDLIRGQLSENYFAKDRPKIPFVLKWIMTDNLANWLTRPDFVAYRYEDRHCTLSNYFCLRRMSCVSWTVTTQKDFDKAVKEGWIPIFEGFLPDPTRRENN